MRHELDAIGQQSAPADSAVRRGFGWRHAATVVLLLVTLPVFAAAGIVALALLPLILAVVGLDQLRQFLRPEPEVATIPAGR